MRPIHLWHLLWIVYILGFLTPVQGQDNEESLNTTMVERAVVYAGPGTSYATVAVIGAGEAVTVTERSEIGLWVHVIRPEMNINGWVGTGYVDLPEGMRLTDLPITDLSSADPSRFIDEDIIRLYSTPIMPTVSPAMLEVYTRGQELGNDPRVAVKVGDSNSANSRFLEPIAQANIDLGPYDMLAAVVDYYGAGFEATNIAAQIGLNSYSLFDPMWSNDQLCEDNETPLHCDYRLNRPSVAVIVLGQNDTHVLNDEQWRVQIERIVTESLDLGVIPLLVTFSSDRESETYFHTIRFNLILLDIAETYEVPLLNFWSAARDLPNYGIGDDDAHLTGGSDVMSFNGSESFLGVPLLNLTVLAALDRIREATESADSAESVN